MADYVMVTDWEEVDKDDFYLSKDWGNIPPENKIQEKVK